MKAMMWSMMACCMLLAHASLICAQDTPASTPNPSFITNVRLFSEDAVESEREERRDEIETDRDSFTPSTTTTGKGRLIIESAWSFLDNRGYKETNSFPEALVRIGISKRLELRLGTNYEIGGIGSDIAGSEGGGDELQRSKALESESNISYGVKYRLSESDSWLPESAVILQAYTPTSGKTTNTQLVSTYAFGWELPKGMKLDAAFRYVLATEESDHFNEWAPSVVLKVPLGERINVHAEYFGIFSTNKTEMLNRQYFSPGVHYLVTDNFEIGVRLGWGLNDQSSRFFSNVGIGIRF